MQMSNIEPLELKRAVISEIDDAIVAIGDNKRVFPYRTIEIRLLIGDEAMRGLFRAAFVDNNLLEETIHAHLKPPRCEEAEPRVKIIFTDEKDKPQLKKPYDITFISDLGPKDAEAYLEVLDGLANRKQIHLKHLETFIGRCEYPAARGEKMVRKNDLFFLDSRDYQGRMSKDLKANEKVNQSVSRTHAHIYYNEQQDSYYIYDDGSSKGTTLLRGGRGVAVNVDRRVGKLLENGDIICFGKAKVKFKVIGKNSTDAKSEAAE
jgi:FHA domain